MLGLQRKRLTRDFGATHNGAALRGQCQSVKPFVVSPEHVEGSNHERRVYQEKMPIHPSTLLRTNGHFFLTDWYWAQQLCSKSSRFHHVFLLWISD